MQSAVKGVRTNQGEIVAGTLKGSWRQAPTPLDLDEETLRRMIPVLSASGVSGLVWRRIRGTVLESSQPAKELQEAFRYNVLRNALHVRDLKVTAEILDAKGIEYVLIKGWSLGPLYPEPGLRVFGDIDICLRPSDYRAAWGALREAWPGTDIDLHAGFGKFYETRTEELLARSEPRELEGDMVRVLRAEDHFRFLCLHMLRHGGKRPHWLCDIAASLENLPRGFDWDLCLSGGRGQAELVTGAIGLAHLLLEARIDEVPVADKARSVPRWMIATVLKEWSAPFTQPLPLSSYLSSPVRLLRELPKHWPNAIEATVNIGAGLNEMPRWPLQLADALSKTWGLLTGSRTVPRPPTQS